MANAKNYLEINGEYVREFACRKGGLAKISREMGFSSSYLGESCKRGTLSPLALNYLVTKYGINKQRALDAKPQIEESHVSYAVDIDSHFMELFRRFDGLSSQMKDLEKGMFAIHKYMVDLLDSLKVEETSHD